MRSLPSYESLMRSKISWRTCSIVHHARASRAVTWSWPYVKRNDTCQGCSRGKATEHTEYMCKMEASLSTLDPGKRGEILRAAATEDKDMDDDEVTNVAAICWNVSALNGALASCLITTTQAKLARLFVKCCKHSQDLSSERGRRWTGGTDQNQLREQLPWPASSRHRERSRLVNFSASSWTGTPCGRTRGETQRIRLRSRQGRSTDEDDDNRDGRTLHRRPQHVPWIEESRRCTCRGEDDSAELCSKIGFSQKGNVIFTIGISQRFFAGFGVCSGDWKNKKRKTRVEKRKTWKKKGKHTKQRESKT